MQMKSITDFLTKRKKLLMIIGAGVILLLIILSIAQLFRDRRVVKQTDEYTIEYDRSDDRFIATSTKSMSESTFNEIYEELEKLCKGKDKTFDECSLVNIPGVSFGASDEELRLIQENKDEIEKALQKMRDGKNGFNETPTDAD